MQTSPKNVKIAQVILPVMLLQFIENGCGSSLIGLPTLSGLGKAPVSIQ